MKKTFSVLIILAILVVFAGCGSPTQSGNITPTSTPNEEHTEVTAETIAETQAESKSATNNKTVNISEAEAVKAALSHAKIKEDEITHLITEFDIDDGVEIFEVDFHYGQYEYDYEIDAKTGSILSYDKDLED